LHYRPFLIQPDNVKYVILDDLSIKLSEPGFMGLRDYRDEIRTRIEFWCWHNPAPPEVNELTTSSRFYHITP